jgi:hypothetical protein
MFFNGSYGYHKITFLDDVKKYNIKRNSIVWLKKVIKYDKKTLYE